jgi:hypothetical protein
MTQTTHRAPTTRQPSRMVMARSRGAMVGTLLVVLGAWGAIIPFIGHSFGYGYTPNNTWTWTAGRFWLELLPGVVTMVCGWLIATSRSRVTGTIAGWVAAAAGAWFVLGTVVSPLWNSGFNGVPSGNAHHGAYEQLGMFAGLGVLIVFLAAIAIGRFSVVGVRDVAVGRARMDRQVQPVAADPGTTGEPAVTASAGSDESTTTDNRETVNH